MGRERHLQATPRGVKRTCLPTLDLTSGLQVQEINLLFEPPRRWSFATAVRAKTVLRDGAGAPVWYNGQWAMVPHKDTRPGARATRLSPQAPRLQAPTWGTGAGFWVQTDR